MDTTTHTTFTTITTTFTDTAVKVDAGHFGQVTTRIARFSNQLGAFVPPPVRVGLGLLVARHGCTELARAWGQCDLTGRIGYGWLTTAPDGVCFMLDGEVAGLA